VDSRSDGGAVVATLISKVASGLLSRLGRGVTTLILNAPQRGTKAHICAF
jgi:hypothetical protein